MGLTDRITKLEGEAAAEPGRSEYAERWLAAYERIAATMAPDDLADVHARALAHLGGRRSRREAPDDFLTARVLSLVERAANCLPVALRMPPELAAAWREHDARHAGSDEETRFRASFGNQECAECGAEHPWLGRYEFSAEAGRYVIVNPDELIKTCLVCGGPVGRPGVWRRAESEAVH